MAVARHASDGNLDPTFGTGGNVTTSFGASYSATGNGAAIKGCGVIVVVTLADLSFGGTSAIGVVRYRL